MADKEIPFFEFKDKILVQHAYRPLLHVKLAAAFVQISRQDFSKALKELGHEPEHYRGKKLPLVKLLDQYKLEEEEVLNAIEKKMIAAHYDYYNDIIFHIGAERQFRISRGLSFVGSADYLNAYTISQIRAIFYF